MNDLHTEERRGSEDVEESNELEEDEDVSNRELARRMRRFSGSGRIRVSDVFHMVINRGY